MTEPKVSRYLAIARLIFAVLGVALGPVAVVMIAEPRSWYDIFPGVAARGEFNAHFVRDLGCAFAVCAASFIWCAIDPLRGRGAAAAATAFLSCHALVHLIEGLTGGHHHPGAFTTPDITSAYLPALLSLVGLRIVVVDFWPRRQAQ